jgi:hypothetical protein
MSIIAPNCTPCFIVDMQAFEDYLPVWTIYEVVEDDFRMMWFARDIEIQGTRMPRFGVR